MRSRADGEISVHEALSKFEATKIATRLLMEGSNADFIGVYERLEVEITIACKR